MLMGAPGWAQNPRKRIALTLVLRELSFSDGALVLAASLNVQWGERGTHLLATIARYVITMRHAVFQFRAIHARQSSLLRSAASTNAPFWTYLAAAVYAIVGTLLPGCEKTHPAAAWLGFTVLSVELVVDVPIFNRAVFSTDRSARL
jgi:hypothetical protein